MGNPSPEPIVRARTFTWHDPMAMAELAQKIGGLEYLSAAAAGRLPRPPIMELMGIQLAEVEEGRIVFAVTPAEYHYNPIGVVHGGLAATLLDSAMGCAIHTTLPAGTAYTTLEIKVNYVRAMSISTGEVRCEGTVIHRGGRVATAEGRITDARGKLYAHGTTTCMIFQP